MRVMHSTMRPRCFTKSSMIQCRKPSALRVYALEASTSQLPFFPDRRVRFSDSKTHTLIPQLSLFVFAPSPPLCSTHPLLDNFFLMQLVTHIPLPSLKDSIHFINLTNGLEALPTLQKLNLPTHFIRIQSTACEQQNFERLMTDLDSSLLLHLALGRCCLVYDYGSRNKERGASRAIWYGITFIQYCLETFWFLENDVHNNEGNGQKAVAQRAFLRGFDARKAFDTAIDKFSRPTKRKLRYYAQYVDPSLDTIKLYGVYAPTENDDDK